MESWWTKIEKYKILSRAGKKCQKIKSFNQSRLRLNIRLCMKNWIHFHSLTRTKTCFFSFSLIPGMNNQKYSKHFRKLFLKTFQNDTWSMKVELSTLKSWIEKTLSFNCIIDQNLSKRRRKMLNKLPCYLQYQQHYNTRDFFFYLYKKLLCKCRSYKRSFIATKYINIYLREGSKKTECMKWSRHTILKFSFFKMEMKRAVLRFLRISNFPQLYNK